MCTHSPEDDKVVRQVSLGDHIFRVLGGLSKISATHGLGVCARVAGSNLVPRQHAERVVAPRRQLHFHAARVLRHIRIDVDPGVRRERGVKLDDVVENWRVVFSAWLPLNHSLVGGVDTTRYDAVGRIRNT